MITALTGQTKTAYKILEVGFEIIVPATGRFPAQIAAVQDLEICLSRRIKTAMPDSNDVDVIKKFRFAGQMQTAASFAPIFEPLQIWQPLGEVLIVEDPLYVMIDTTGTGDTWTATMWVDYELTNISEIERLTLLSQSLQ